MVTIDFEKFIKDRIWFGWYWATFPPEPYDPLSLTEVFTFSPRSFWTRSTTSHWTIIDRTAAGRRHD